MTYIMVYVLTIQHVLLCVLYRMSRDDDEEEEKEGEGSPPHYR